MEPSLRSGAAEASGLSLRIQRRGRTRSKISVIDETTGEELARAHRDGRRRLLELNGRVAEWKRLGRKRGLGLVGPNEEPFVRATVRSGIVRLSGEVRTSDLGEHEAVTAALLASYLLIRKNEANDHRDRRQSTAYAGVLSILTDDRVCR